MYVLQKTHGCFRGAHMCVCALDEYLCLLTRAHMCVPRVHTCALIAHAVFLDT